MDIFLFLFLLHIYLTNFTYNVVQRLIVGNCDSFKSIIVRVAFFFLHGLYHLLYFIVSLFYLKLGKLLYLKLCYGSIMFFTPNSIILIDYKQLLKVAF